MGEERRGPVGRSTFGRMVAIGLIASVVGIAIGLAIDWFPVQASEQAERIDTLWDVLIVVSVPIFVLVVTVVLTCVVKFRMRRGEELLDGPPIHGNTRLEIIWTSIPAVILVSLCTYAYIVLTDIEDAPANPSAERHVEVTGQQFAWTFRYREGGRSFSTTRLYLPVGESVKFDVKAKDVIHDFWIPAMRMKIDAVPGETTRYRITPNRAGTYPIVCAELCGLGHAYMRNTAYVVSPQRFDTWVAEQLQGGGSAEAGGQAQAGSTGAGTAVDAKTLFTAGNGTSTACGACHELADAGTPGGVGPNLDDGLKGRDAAFIKTSIVDPQAEIAKGYPGGVMPPNYGQTLKPAELDSLVDYLVKATK